MRRREMRAMICRIVHRAFIDGSWKEGGCRKENFATANVDSTPIEPALSAKAYWNYNLSAV